MVITPVASCQAVGSPQSYLSSSRNRCAKSAFGLEASQWASREQWSPACLGRLIKIYRDARLAVEDCAIFFTRTPHEVLFTACPSIKLGSFSLGLFSVCFPFCFERYPLRRHDI